MASPFERLLEVQDLDVRADQLRHRREHLPERGQVVEGTRRRTALAAEAAPQRDERDRLAAEQRRLEDEAATVEAKAAAEDKRLYSGTVTSPRELQAIQEEIAALKRRQGDLEDRALALMEAIEPIDAALEDVRTRDEAVQAELVSLRERITVAEAEVDAALADLATERGAAVADIDPELLSRYEGLRGRFGGVPLARLVAGSCDGCHLKLSSVEFDRIQRQPADAVVLCEECGRILVR
jgi:predicted  nucleic acid-binding Zn-ribbon protein